MATARQVVVGVAIAAAVSMTLAAMAIVVCGIFCPPLVIAAVPFFFKFAAVFFAAAALFMIGREVLKVASYALGSDSKTTPNPVVPAPVPGQ